MIRYIDPTWLYENVQEQAPQFAEMLKNLILVAPSIGICFCWECEYGEYRADFDGYECHESGCGLVHDAEFYCADGKRRNERYDECDYERAVEQMQHDIIYEQTYNAEDGSM